MLERAGKKTEMMCFLSGFKHKSDAQILFLLNPELADGSKRRLAGLVGW